MGPKIKRLLIFFIPAFFIGCAPKNQSIQIRWSPHQNRTLSEVVPEKILSELKKSREQSKAIEVEHKQIFRGQQRLGNIEVEDTWFHWVEGIDGEIEAFSLRWMEDISDVDRVQAIALDRDKNEVLKKAVTISSLLNEAKEVSDPSVVLKRELWNWASYVKVIVTPKNETDVFATYISADGRVRGYESVAHHIDGVGMVFTGNPDRSHLSEEILHDLVGDGTLSSRNLKVHSGVNAKPFSENHVFRYLPDEKAFDNVQTFFFVDQTVRWFKNQLSLQLPFVLDVKVHIGGVTPTNAAFYYDGNIRLGEGDGRSYKAIPRDPSIVFHETSHAFVERLSGLGFEGEAGSYSEAFADFFAASQLGSPEMAQYAYLKSSYKRTLKNDKKAFSDFNGGKYNDSLVVSGTFWALREALGDEKSLQLAKEFLIRLGPGGLLAELPHVLREVSVEVLSSEDVKIVEDVLQKRGWNT